MRSSLIDAHWFKPITIMRYDILAWILYPIFLAGTKVGLVSNSHLHPSTYDRNTKKTQAHKSSSPKRVLELLTASTLLP
jgi:hypothetical protein